MMERLELEVTCPFCGDTNTVSVNENAYHAWNKGDGVIQNLMPELTADERELLMTGICTPCWDKSFMEG